MCLWRLRRRQDDPAACEQANTQGSDHRFSFSLGINFLPCYQFEGASNHCTTGTWQKFNSVIRLSLIEWV